MTAIRTRTNLSATRSPRPALPHGWVARIRFSNATDCRHDDESVAGQTRVCDGEDFDGPATERGERPVGGGELSGYVAPLPRDEDPAGLEQGQGHLDEVGEVRDGAGDDCRPLTAVAAVAGERLGPHGGRL